MVYNIKNISDIALRLGKFGWLHPFSKTGYILSFAEEEMKYVASFIHPMDVEITNDVTHEAAKLEPFVEEVKTEIPVVEKEIVAEVKKEEPIVENIVATEETKVEPVVEEAKKEEPVIEQVISNVEADISKEGVVVEKEIDHEIAHIVASEENN